MKLAERPIDADDGLRWDDNLIDMCIGEKRTLTIPPEFGYGDRNMGPIPASSTLSTLPTILYIFLLLIMIPQSSRQS